MSSYEVKIAVLDTEYIDQLVISLVRQGYSVHFNAEDEQKGVVCFVAGDDTVVEIKE